VIWWFVSILFGALALFILSCNIAGLIWARWTGRNFSAVPFIAGVFTVLSLLTLPVDGVARFWWVPLIVDYTFPLTLCAILLLPRTSGRD
jgi:low temperature requirement protein LtrA